MSYLYAFYLVLGRQIGVDIKTYMMVRINKILALFLGVVIASGYYAQDPEFTQFYANPLYLNPAFAGSKQCPRISLNYRNQWPGISGNFKTFSASYDQMVNSISGGLGLMVLTDNAANTLKTTRVSGIYSFHQQVTRKFSINAAAEATFFQKSLDWSKLTFGDMIDPRRGFVYQTNDVPRGGTVSNVDFSAGILGYSKQFYIGFAVDHLTQPNESLLKNPNAPGLPMKYTFHAGANIPVDGRTSTYSKTGTFISPNIMYRRQGEFQQLNMGLYVKKDNITGGVWYRNKDSFILTFGIETDFIRIGYSYDVTISKLTMATAGSHEVSMGFNFACKPKKKQFRTISCPSF